MAVCCKKKRDTPFCPDCGKPLAALSPEQELLNYLAKNAANFSRKLERCDESEHDGRVAAHYRKALDKWERWETIVRGLLEEGVADANA